MDSKGEVRGWKEREPRGGVKRENQKVGERERQEGCRKEKDKKGVEKRKTGDVERTRGG